MTAAGTAGGTAMTLAKLGAQVRSAGAIGDDALGDALLGLLRRGGVDTSLLVRRDAVSRPRPACCRSAPTARGPPFT